MCMYTELDLKEALDYILTVCKQRGISKRELCKGVYDYSSFIKMCNGKKNITLNVLIQCCDKLDLSPSVLFNTADYDSCRIYASFKQELESTLYYHNYNQLLELMNRIDLLKSDSNQLSQLRIKIEAIYHIECLKQYSYARDLLVEAMNISKLHFSLNHYQLSGLNEEEMSIINLIILTYIKEGKIKVSRKMILEMIDQYSKTITSGLLYDYLLLMQVYALEKDYDNVIILGKSVLNKAKDQLCFQVLYEAAGLLNQAYEEKGNLVIAKEYVLLCDSYVAMLNLLNNNKTLLNG